MINKEIFFRDVIVSIILLFFCIGKVLCKRYFSLSFWLSLSLSLSLFLWLQIVVMKQKERHFWRILTYKWIASDCISNRQTDRKRRNFFLLRLFSRYCFFSSFFLSNYQKNPMAPLLIPMRYLILFLVLIQSVTLYKIYAFDDTDDDDDVSWLTWNGNSHHFDFQIIFSSERIFRVIPCRHRTMMRAIKLQMTMTILRSGCLRWERTTTMINWPKNVRFSPEDFFHRNRFLNVAIIDHIGIHSLPLTNAVPNYHVQKNVNHV